MVHFSNDWDDILIDEFSKEYYLELREFLKKEYSTYDIYPPMDKIFNALKNTSYSDTKVVILGQDPYHEPGQAQGLSFSVPDNIKTPPSLINIFKEIENTTGIKSTSNDLTRWAKQGVLLLNAVLTVRKGAAGSHRNKGWETFTDSVISHLNEREKPIVFILWGAYAKEKINLITNPNHLILTGAHPSPLSAYSGFFGGDYFNRANRFLEAIGEEKINW